LFDPNRLALASLQYGTANDVGQKVTKNPLLYQNTNLHILTILYEPEPSAPLDKICVPIGIHIFCFTIENMGRNIKFHQYHPIPYNPESPHEIFLVNLSTILRVKIKGE
jgi:hypothetical protein